MAENKQTVFEFRGVDNLYVAEVLKDDADGYVGSTPMYLAPVAEVGKTTDSSSEAHYYDNKAMIVINSESADTISITMAPPELKNLALITGKAFDASTGMYVDSERQNRYFALMYRTKGTDGQYRYVSRLKGQFTIPEEVSATENDGTDANNTSVTFTGIYTEHKFNKGVYKNGVWQAGSAKGIVVDTRYGLANVTQFFDSVQTPDTISAGTVGGIAVLPSSANLGLDDTIQLQAILYPTGATGTVTWTTSDDEKATVSDTGLVTAVGAGTATITATCNGITDTCTVVVTGA